MDNPWRPAARADRVEARDLRASDTDRESVVTLLAQAVADGRLTPAEHGDRMERAYAARTLGELSVLTLDLVPAEEQPIRVDERPPHAMFGSVRRSGRWVVPVRLPVTAWFGTVELDLREAILQRRHVVIDVNVLCGTVRLLVPEGVRVDVSGRTILSTRELRIRRPGEPTGPVVEIGGTLVLGSIKARTPRRDRRWRLRGR